MFAVPFLSLVFFSVMARNIQIEMKSLHSKQPDWIKFVWFIFVFFFSQRYILDVMIKRIIHVKIMAINRKYITYTFMVYLCPPRRIFSRIFLSFQFHFCFFLFCSVFGFGLKNYYHLSTDNIFRRNSLWWSGLWLSTAIPIYFFFFSSVKSQFR